MLSLAIGGCVGQNPWWDPPIEGLDGTDADGTLAETSLGDRGGETGTTTFDATTADTAVADTTSAESTSSVGVSADDGGSAEAGSADPTDVGGGTTGADGSSSGGATTGDNASESDDGGPACAPPMAICDGECVDVQSHHHHCGVECIDCMEVYGPSTHCVDGECDVDD